MVKMLVQGLNRVGVLGLGITLLVTAGCSMTDPEVQPQPPEASLSLSEAQALARTLRDLGYEGPFAVSTATPIIGGRRQAPVRGLMIAGEMTDGHAVVIEALSNCCFQAASMEATDPDAADPANNSLPGGLGVQIVPSVLNRANGQSRVLFNFRFADFKPGTDSVFLVPAGEVLSHRLLARVRAAGHYHGDSLSERTLARRVGTLQLSSTTFTGSLPAEWLVPEVAGEVWIEFTIRQIGGPKDGSVDVFSSTKPNGVRLPGLIRLPQDDNLYARVGATATHPNGFSHWGQPELILAIVRAAAAYKAATGGRASVNDMSLFYGGKFDIWRNLGGGQIAVCANNQPDNCWGGPGGPSISHVEHRHGTEVDINPLGGATAAQRLDFRGALRLAFANVEWHSNHFHVRTASSAYLRAP